MANVTIYLPAEVEAAARKQAKRSGLSLGRWVAQEIVRKLDNNWPPEFTALAGSCPDFPDVHKLRSG
jgi:hypothetical protein